MTANEVEAYSAVDANEDNKKTEDNKKNEHKDKESTAVTNTVSLTSTADNNSTKQQQRGRRAHSPIVKGRSMTGTIKWFSVRKGYGFIRRDDIDEDIFFHGSSIARQTRAALMLAENQKVEFDIIKGVRGLLEAACVSGPDGGRVGIKTGFGETQFRRGAFRRRIGNGEPGNGGDNEQPKAIANGQQNPKPKTRRRNTNRRGPPPSKNASTEGGKTHKDEGMESLEDTIEKEETTDLPKSGDAAEGKKNRLISHN